MRDSGRGRIKALERKVAYLESILEEVVGQNLQMAGILVDVQHDLRAVTKVVSTLATSLNTLSERVTLAEDGEDA